MFTLENTKDATHVSSDLSVFYKNIIEGVDYEHSCEGYWFRGAINPACNELIDLSRPYNETQAHWTTNGVTQYAQPQGNEMDIKNLIPIDFSRKITPVVIDDDFYNTYTMNSFKVRDQSHADAMNVPHDFDSNYFVVSFADRPNTGKQPVGDDVMLDVVVDFDIGNTQEFKGYLPTTFGWEINGERDIKSWKLNYAAMLKQWQQQQQKQEVNFSGNDHHIALRLEALGPIGEQVEFIEDIEPTLNDAIKALSAELEVPVSILIGESNTARPYESISQVVGVELTQDEIDQGLKDGKSLNYDTTTCGWTLIEPEKPVFTQTMADANQLPVIGCDVVIRYMHDSKTVTHTGLVMFASNAYVILMIDGNEHCFKIGDYRYEPIQTSKQKLFDALYLATVDDDISDDLNQQLVMELMNHKDFTITLKG